MPRLVNKLPSYRKHASGQAFVQINGKPVYLGKHNTAASREEYRRVVGEWVASNRKLAPPARSAAAAPGTPDLTMAELLDAYLSHVEATYTGGEVDNQRAMMKCVLKLYGRTAAAAFGPLALKAVRDAMVKLDWSRNHVNAQVRRVRRMFRWAVASELIPASVPAALAAVDGLRAGKCKARETDPVGPVAEAVVDATLEHLSRHVGAMVRFQRYTGARPGEVCRLRWCDIDTTVDPWVYKPPAHKTRHHGHERLVFIGPKAREVLRGFVNLNPQAFVFSPAEAERERREALHLARVENGTPLSCGNVPGSNRQRRPKRTPGERYTPNSYLVAIVRATDRADVAARAKRAEQYEREHGTPIPPEQDTRMVPRWHPHQLRHNVGTLARASAGLDAAQVLLGHRDQRVTQVYAAVHVEAAKRFARDVG